MNARSRSQRSDSQTVSPPGSKPVGGSVGPGPDERLGIASAHDAAGIPVHRGWAPSGGHHRWMEPFVMVLLAGGAAHGYAIVGELATLGITNGTVDVGQVYRTLRDLEQAGQVRSSWSTAGSGPARRDYELTPAGYAALDEWAAVIKERARLIGEFDARYLETISTRHGS
jgi:poly-beta-hydroxybutyrate-responsive repressor